MCCGQHYFANPMNHSSLAGFESIAVIAGMIMTCALPISSLTIAQLKPQPMAVQHMPVSFQSCRRGFGSPPGDLAQGR